MAVYEYRCRTCDDLFELRRPMSESDTLAECPQGHADTLRRIGVLAVFDDMRELPALFERLAQKRAS